MDFSTQVPATQGKFALNILTYNVYGVFGWFSPARKRTAKLVQSGILDSYDVLVFQELFSSGHRRGLVRALQKRNHPHCTGVLNRSGHDRWANGGVLICSRYPIVSPVKEMVYEARAGWDRLVAKGAMHVTIQKDGRKFHLVATHAQADESTLYIEQRTQQVQQLHKWIKQLKLPEHEPLMIVGDMNIPKYRGQGVEYRSMLNTLKVADLPEKRGNGLTLDTPTYDPINNGLAAGQEPLVIDYILPSRRHLLPKESSFKRVLALPYSDHYAVHGYVDFE